MTKMTEKTGNGGNMRKIHEDAGRGMKVGTRKSDDIVRASLTDLGTTLKPGNGMPLGIQEKLVHHHHHAIYHLTSQSLHLTSILWLENREIAHHLELAEILSRIGERDTYILV
jgi:hypothetical protein